MVIYYRTRLKSNLRIHLSLQATKTKPPFLQLGSSVLCFLCLSFHVSSTSKENPNDSSFPKEQTLISLLKKCSTVKDLNQIHAQIIKSGFDQNLFVIGKAIEFCAVSERGNMNYAVSIFEKIRNPDGFLWNTMIRGFGKSSEPQEAFEHYKRMQESGLVADSFTFSFLLKVCGQLGSVLLGKQVHCNALKHGFESHVFVKNTLIHMYGLFKDIDTSRQLFEEILNPELVAWNVILDCYVYCGEYKEALDMFSRMLRFGIEPDEASLVVTLSACSALGALDFGRWVHSLISNTGLRSIIEVNNSIIDMYAKCGALEEAFEIFNKMIKKNIATWNAMILGLATHGYTNEALMLFSKMLEQKAEAPDSVTFLGVLCACSHGGMVNEGRRFFNMMSKEFHIQPTIKNYGCMVDILGRAGFVEEAYWLIRSMPMDCNAIVWRTLLAACNVHGNVELGEQVRKHLLELEPDHSSDYVLLANMYASVGKWNEVTRVRKSMKKRGVQKPEPGNSFIGMLPSMRLEMESIEVCTKAIDMANAT